MAIYSLSLGFVSRSEGRSSVAASAYMSASQHKDERTGEVHNYSQKENVLCSRILAPEGTPSWALNPETLWNRVEQFEDHVAKLRFRCDWEDPQKQQKSVAAYEKFIGTAQTAQTVMGAIPLELSKEQAESCVEEFLKSRFVSRNLITHYAIHWDKGNPHFHALVTRRPLTQGEFSQKKDRDIVSKTEHNITRQIWERVANKHLALAGHDVRIDYRSHQDRGSLFEATLHEGYWAQRLAERGDYSRLVAHNETVRQRNIEILCERPEALIHEISQKRTTFTKQHLEDEIVRRVGGDEKLFGILKSRIDGLNPSNYAPHENFASDVKSVAQKLVSKLLENPELISSVGENLNREKVFTSSVYQSQEKKITQLADTLHTRTSKTLSKEQITSSLNANEESQEFALSKEQQNAVIHLCAGSDIRILNGRAGTGKTTLLKVVADAYQTAGYRVLGTSFQGKAVEIMENEIGISCKTLDSLKFSWERHEHQKALVESGRLWGKPYLYAVQKLQELEKSRFTNKDVILVDEANMISGSLWEPFLEEAASRGAKVLIIQDTAQIKSREAGDYGRLFAERFGTALTQEVMRQKVDWQRECSALLNDGRVLDGLKPYQDKGHIGWHENSGQMREALVERYLRDLHENSGNACIALAYRNKDVDLLNQMIRGALKQQGFLGESFSVMAQEFSGSDRVRFTQNDHHGRFVHNTYDSWLKSIKEHLMPTGPQGVKNGTFGTVLEGNLRNVKVRLDDGRCVKFDPREYTHLTHGYAMGIHKSEGSTFDRAFVQLDPLLDSSTLLVAMTRHRHNIQAFANREEIVDFKAFVDKVGRGPSREILQDYQVSDSQKPYLERIQQYKDLTLEAAALREEMEGVLESTTPLYKHPSYKGYTACLNQKKEIAKEVLNSWDAHLPFTRLAGLRRDVLEMETGLRSRTLSDLEHRASLQVQGYREVAREARTLWNQISETHPPSLVKSHALYQDYQKCRVERDSLAAVFQENPPLYSPLFRLEKDEDGLWHDNLSQVVEKEDRIFKAALAQQAGSHLQSQKQKAFEERLSPAERVFYETTKKYTETTREAASLYHLLQSPKEPALPREMINGFFREACATRDKAAFDIAAAMESHQPFFESFDVREDKLLLHASRGEIRVKAQTYLNATDLGLRATRAEELLKIFQNKEASSFLRTLCQQEGVEMERLNFDITLQKLIQAREIQPPESPDFLFRCIDDYRKAMQEVGKVWNQEGRSKKALLEIAIRERYLTAQNLRAHNTALTIFKAMSPERLAKLEIHAGTIRQETPEKLQNSTRSSEKSFLSAETALSYGRGRIQELAHDLLGSHNIHRSSNNCLRYGNSGKIAVHIRGAQEGLWHDFSTGEGGNIFQLIQREKGLSFKEAVEYCGWFFRVRHEIVDRTTVLTKEKTSELAIVRDNEAETRNTAARLQAVYTLYDKAKPIENTVVDRYLREVRGIRGELSEDLRLLPKSTSFTYNGEKKVLTHDCFAAFGRDARGALSVVQITKLQKDGTRALDKEGEKFNKIQYGLSKGAFVTLQSDPQSNRVLIAEGVETALSIKETGTCGRIVASLGIHNIKNYEGPEKKIVICADNDGPHARTNAVIQHALVHLQTPDRSVVVVRPEKEGQDFNDVLKEKGAESVREQLTPPALRMAELPQGSRFENRETLEKISKLSVELQEKLEAFKENTLDRSFKSDLISHAKMLRHDPDLRDGLRILNPEVFKQMESLIKEQQRDRGMGR